MASTSKSAVTQYVTPDEKVWAFAETWQRSAGKGDRRIQKFWVLRGDSIAVYEEDVGPFNVDTDHIFDAPMCFWEYSVAEMKELALMSRNNVPPREMDDRLDLIEAFVRHVDEKNSQARHRSTFGPHFKKERR